MSIDDRLRDELHVAASHVDDAPTDVTEAIRAGRRRRILVPAAAVVAVLAVVSLAATFSGVFGDGGLGSYAGGVADPTPETLGGEPDLVLLLCDGRYCLADDPDHTQLRAMLDSDPDIAAFRYVSKEEVAERMGQISRVDDPEHLIASFALELVDGADLIEVAERYRSAPGVWPSDPDGATETDAGQQQIEVDLTIFLCDDTTTCPAISDEQRRALERQLVDDPYALEYEFESREQAYARFSELFEDEPELVAATSPDSLPESFRVQVRADADADTVIEHYGAFDGVADVVWQRPADG